MSCTHASAPPLMPADKLILFDGICKLCNAWCHFIIQHDKNHHFRLASVQSPAGQYLLKHFGYPTDVYETMLVIAEGRCLEKSDAFFYVMKTLGYPWRLLLIFKILPRAINDWLYDRIALNRYRLFGKYDYCRLPSADHDQRYLE